MSAKLKTPRAILSYPHLHTPQESSNGKAPKYGAALIFTPEVLAIPEERALFDALKQALKDAAIAKFGADKVAALFKNPNFKPGIRTDAKDGYPEGSVYINARAAQQPGFVYAHAEPGTNPPKPARIPLDKIKDELYPGAIVRASVSAFGFDTDGNKGVSFGLNNIQKLADGERLDGRVAAENEFDVDLSQAPADLDNLFG